MSDPMRLFERILSSDGKADLLFLFRRNPKLVDSRDGLAKRIGRTSAEIDGDLRDLEDVGLLSRESPSDSRVFRYDE
jgi:predicted transcriptional regulator